MWSTRINEHRTMLRIIKFFPFFSRLHSSILLASVQLIMLVSVVIAPNSLLRSHHFLARRNSLDATQCADGYFDKITLLHHVYAVRVCCSLFKLLSSYSITDLPCVCSNAESVYIHTMIRFVSRSNLSFR